MTMATSGSDTLINATEAKRLAGSISDMTLWRWQREGIIPEPIKIRSRKYYNRDEFLAAIAKADQGVIAKPGASKTNLSADQAHRERIHAEINADFHREAAIAHDERTISEVWKITQAIAAGRIRHLTINY